jgi:hypothetical protein
MVYQLLKSGLVQVNFPDQDCIGFNKTFPFLNFQAIHAVNFVKLINRVEAAEQVSEFDYSGGNSWRKSQTLNK